MRVQDILFDGQKDTITFYLDAGCQAGDAVTLTGAGKVGRGNANDPLYGKLTYVNPDGQTGVVETEGFHDFNYSGTASTPGVKKLVVDGAGNVTEYASSTYPPRPVVAVDTTTTTVCVHLD